MEPTRGAEPPRTAADYARLNEPHETEIRESKTSGSTFGTAKNQLNEAAETIKQTARGFAEEKKVQGANRIEQIGKAVHGAASELGKELPEAARFFDTAAENLQSAAAAMRNHSVGDLTEKFNRFARRQPLAAFAGSVVAGFMLSRFLKSSPR